MHDANLVGADRPLPACDLDIEQTAIALDQAHAPRGVEPAGNREQRARDDIDPGHEHVGEGAKVHCWNPVRNARVGGTSMSARQDRMRKGSLVSPRRMTASDAIRRPLSKLIRAVTRVAALVSAPSNC